MVAPRRYPETPSVDKRANEKFVDDLFDTDGKPNSEAEAVVEREGFDEEDEDDDADR